MHSINPRRSLVAALIWLMVGLAASFAVAASLWAGRVAREIVVQQHIRRLLLETEQLGSDLGQAVSARLTAVGAAHLTTPLPASFQSLARTYPELGWIAMADAAGTVVAGDGSLAVGSDVAAAAWFTAARDRPWIGVIRETAGRIPGATLGDVSMPVKDASGRLLGVIAAHLTWHWATVDLQRLSAGVNPSGRAQTLILDADTVVRVGPNPLLGRRWPGAAMDRAVPGWGALGEAAQTGLRAPRFERLGPEDTVLVARAPLVVQPAGATPAWQVQLSEPREQVYLRADALAVRIVWISVCLGTATALLGALGARHLTNRLRRLAQSAAAVGRDEIEQIEVPSGDDEVAQLANVLAKVLGDLKQERSELRTLSGELERRVAVRTREVERLAEEARYAAIVRERLNIARDLHDTLAHSMMAMLSEVRMLRKLEAHEPKALADELARAEEVARSGLNEARTAIAQMRLNVVRDTGLGPALARALDRFIDRTGIDGRFHADAVTAHFGDERAEVLFRMAEEALRNIERHALAARVTVSLTMHDEDRLSLEVEDDGVGFETDLARPGHYGLVGLREQAQLIGAELRIVSAPQAGTRLTVTLRIAPEVLRPLDAPAHAS